MDAALQRLYRGDVSQVAFILGVIEGPQPAPTGTKGRTLYGFLGTLLYREGLISLQVEADQARLHEHDPYTVNRGCRFIPPMHCIYALQILSNVGARIGLDGVDCRAALLALGLQNCRAMRLDAYMEFSSSKWPHADIFIHILIRLFGCCASDLLLSDANISQIEASSIPSISARPVGAAPSQECPFMSSRIGGDGAQDTDQGLVFHVRSSTLSRSDTTSVPIIGASFTPLALFRGIYRPLPKTPLITCYAVNPMYDPKLRAEDNTLILPQFPFAVTQFFSIYGLGCIPHIPSAASFEPRQLAIAPSPKGGAVDGPDVDERFPQVLEIFDDFSNQAAFVGGAARMSPDRLDPLLAPAQLARQAELVEAAEGIVMAGGEGGGVAREVRVSFIEAAAVSTQAPDRASSAAASVGARGGLSDAPEVFTSSQSAAAFELNRRCLTCRLLQDYLVEGQLLSWGDTSFHALGPSSAPSPHPRPLPVDPDVSSSPSLPRAVAPVSTAATTPSAPITTSGSGLRDARASAGSGPQRFVPAAVWTPARAVDVVCGEHATYILTDTGTLYSCGRAKLGQLGIGEDGYLHADNGAERFQRVVLSRDGRAVRVFAGSATAAAVASDGNVYCWGRNIYGQCLRRASEACVMLPIRFRTGRLKPTTFVFGICFGGILFEDGVVGMWGDSRLLGTPVSQDALEPTLVPDGSLCSRRVQFLLTDFDAAVAVLRAGPLHVVAITITGNAYTWGIGQGGRLGHGSSKNELSPRRVAGLDVARIMDAACGHAHTVFLSMDGGVYACGVNKFGQLGLRGEEELLQPLQLTLPAPAIAVACNEYCTFILLETGNVVACGCAIFSGAGLGLGRTFVVPAYVLPNYTTLLLASGPTHSFAAGLARTTALMRVGDSSVAPLSRMANMVVRRGVRSVAAGVGFVIVLSENGAAAALGRGECGQLGTGPEMRPTHPGVPVVAPVFKRVLLPPRVRLVALACGPDFVLAIDRAGRVFGWGSNAHGVLALPPDTKAVYEPTQITAYKDRRIVQLACGGSFVVALTESGKVLTHGESVYCGLPLPSSGEPAEVQRGECEQVQVPTRVPGLRRMVAIAAGRHHAVAMAANCQVYAWGRGVLGCGSDAASVVPVPTRVVLTESIRKIGCGPDMSFAITCNSELYVWGGNAHYQCGVPSTVASPAPPEEDPHSSESRSGHVAGADVAVPTLIVRGVRDAAFTATFGIAIGEEGDVRACGELRHGGCNYRLRSFAHGPQPNLTVDSDAEGGRASADGGGSSSGGGAGAGPGHGASRDDDDNGVVVSTGPPPPRGCVYDEGEFFSLARIPLPGGGAAGRPLASDGATGNGNGGGERRALAEAERMTTTADTPGGAAGVAQEGSPPQRRLSAAGVARRRAASAAATAARPTLREPLSATPATETVQAPPAHERVASAPPPPPLAEQLRTGICCFGGWEQVFAVMEKHRPSVADVRLAHRGLRVFHS